MGKAWQIGRISGIPVEFDLSAVLVAAIIAFTLATSAFPAQFPEFDAATYAFLGVSASVLLFVSVIAHELAHALVARYDGLGIEGITLFAFGGVARLSQEPRTAREELRMASAGPLCSLLLGGVLIVSVVLLNPTHHHSPLLALFAYLGAINLALGLFNLLPGFPLDGGRIFRALLWGTTKDLRRATWASAALGQAIALLIVFWGILRFVESAEQNAVAGGLVSSIFLVFTGLFLAEAARRSYQLVAQREAAKVSASVEDVER